MEPLFITEAAGRLRSRLLIVIGAAGLATSLVASAMLDDWAIAAVAFFAIIVTLGANWLFEPITFAVHRDRIEIRFNWRRSSIELDKVASVRIGRWWETYSRFMSTHYGTDFGHLVVLEKTGQTVFDRGWLLSPRDREGFIAAVEAALGSHRQPHVASP